MTNSKPINAKRFTVTVSPEYRDGHILVLTKEEAKTIAEAVILTSISNNDNSLRNWAEEVYFG